MRLQTYRDESRSRHFDLICGRERTRSIDLVLVTTSGMLDPLKTPLRNSEKLRGPECS
jgi:hypothetical protein